MSNKITEISEQIKALKDITFGEIFTQQLKASKIPFPEKFEHYIEQLIENAAFTGRSILNINSANKQSDGWHVEMQAQPFSYIELDDQHYNFPANGILNVVVPLKESEPFFVAKYTWLPYDESFEASYTKPQDDQYFNNITVTVNFPEKQDKGTIECGYLISNSNKDQLIFISSSSDKITGSLENGFSIQGLLPEFTFTIGGKEFTSDTNGTITITTKEAFEIVNTYSEQKSTIPVISKYNGILKDHTIKEKDIPFTNGSIPGIIGNYSYVPTDLDALKPTDNSTTYYNRTNVPLEVEYLSETSTIPVDGSKELNTTFDTVEKLKTIKANATDKFKIKNTFNYPWNKEFTIDSLSVLLDKDYLISQVNTNRNLDLTVEVLGKTFNSISDAYYFMNSSYPTPTKEFLESVDEHTTELGATIKDKFNYPWKKFLHVYNLDQFLNKDYLINSASISYVTNTEDGYYFSKHSDYSYKFNNKELTFDSNNQTVLSYKDVYNYLKDKDNDTLPFTIDINSNYYNKNINFSSIVNFQSLYSNYLYNNNQTIENKAGIKKLKAYTIDKSNAVVYNLPEEETFSSDKLLPMSIKFKKKINDGSDVSIGIADDDCTNSIFLDFYVAKEQSGNMPYSFFENFSTGFNNSPTLQSYNIDSIPELKQYIIDNYQIVTSSGNVYDIHNDSSQTNTFIIEDKINNELLFAQNLYVTLKHKNDNNDEFFKKENISFDSNNITGSINLSTSISVALTALGKSYNKNQNCFNFIKLDNSYDGTATDLDSALTISGDLSKFVGMKTLCFIHESNSTVFELINSNEEILAINSIKAYFVSSRNSFHIIVNYNTATESNKVVDKEIDQYNIRGILYGYDLNKLMDTL